MVIWPLALLLAITCFKYSNELCKTILNIYVSRAFQWYKELFNQMSFDSWNYFRKIQESMGIPTPKVGAHLGVCGLILSHSLTFPWPWNVTPGFHSWLTPLQALVLVASPRLGSQHRLLLHPWLLYPKIDA